MTSKTPEYESEKYWDSRVQQRGAFEWLLPASCLDPQIVEALSKHPPNSADILHIGCGTSLLSFHLREHVGDPGRIHNVDFSAKVIEWGLKNEKVVFGQDLNDGTQKAENEALDKVQDCHHGAMRWSQIDLLSQPSVLSSCPRSSYAIIVDKSTSDAVACGNEVEVRWPGEPNDEVQDCSVDQNKTMAEKLYIVHPICTLALNLALVAAPGCRWIVLSYSSDRFLFLNDSRGYGSIPAALLDIGFPNPARFWKLCSKEPVDAPEEPADGPAHRPHIYNWIYVLERTGETLQPW